ncbi:MAG: carbon-nitrogen family hydrolase [Anaerolineaceae bacterium]|nr:carbon-nitrogen family hydrolase [Anaerolineaceae bacterium]
MKISISLAQLNLKLGNTAKNLENAFQMISVASESKSDLILLPELWSSSYDLENCHKYAEKNRKINLEVANFAKQKNITVGGSLLREFQGDIFNTFTMLNSDGKILAQYDKIHLFRLMDEHIWMKPGNKIQTVDFPWGKTGLAICYDLRFPELFRRYAHSGVKLILLVAEWPQTRINHWNTLLQARAIENQVFIAAVNCVGKTGQAVYGGSSMIIDPWGEILINGDLNNPQILTAEIDLTLVDDVKNKIPVLDDCRPDIYFT